MAASATAARSLRDFGCAGSRSKINASRRGVNAGTIDWEAAQRPPKVVVPSDASRRSFARTKDGRMHPIIVLLFAASGLFSARPTCSSGPAWQPPSFRGDVFCESELPITATRIAVFIPKGVELYVENSVRIEVVYTLNSTEPASIKDVRFIGEDVEVLLDDLPVAATQQAEPILLPVAALAESEIDAFPSRFVVEDERSDGQPHARYRGDDDCYSFRLVVPAGSSELRIVYRLSYDQIDAFEFHLNPQIPSHIVQVGLVRPERGDVSDFSASAAPGDGQLVRSFDRSKASEVSIRLREATKPKPPEPWPPEAWTLLFTLTFIGITAVFAPIATYKILRFTAAKRGDRGERSAVVPPNDATAREPRRGI